MGDILVNGKFCAQRTTGVQRYAWGLLNALDEQLEGAPRRWRLIVPAGSAVPPLRFISVEPLAWKGPGGSHGWEQFALPSAARGHVLLNLGGSAPAFFAGPMVCTLHDAVLFDHPESYTRAFGLWYRWLFRRLARRAHATLVTNSCFSRARLAQALAIEPERLNVITPGAGHLDAVRPDERLIDELGLRGRAFLLAVASRNPTKNLLRLVEAWHRLEAGPARLVLVGAAHARVFASSGKLPAADGVIDAGPVDDASLKALYGAAAALVFPSLYEGFGLPPVEAMACGCPVIASTAPAVHEACAGSALEVDPLDTGALAAAMRRVLDDDALREQLRAQGLQRARELRWSDSARRLRHLVEAAV